MTDEERAQALRETEAQRRADHDRLDRQADNPRGR